MNKKVTLGLAVFLLFVFACLVFSVSVPSRKSGTCDEIAHHIPVGYLLLSKWDFKMDPSHPPLSRYLIGLPLKLFLKLHIPDTKEAWRIDDRAEYGRDFFYKYNPTYKQSMILLSRMSIGAIGILCGILLFVWVSVLYGRSIGLVALFLYCFSPDIIAHSSLATTDMTATCFIFLSIISFWRFLQVQSRVNILIAAVCLGLAQLSKYTALVLYPLFLLLSCFELKNNKKSLLTKFLSICIGSVLVVWAGYGFSMHPILSDARNVSEKMTSIHAWFLAHPMLFSEQITYCINIFLTRVAIPLDAHILGIAGVFRHSHEGHKIFLLGHTSTQGSLFYFPLAFIIKSPIPLLVLVFGGAWFMLKNAISTRERFVLMSATTFFLVAAASNLQLGIRYMLPAFPFIFILGAVGVKWLALKGKKIVIAGLLVWYAFIAAKTWPNYLSYFNEFIGGSSQGYKYLRDSNLDWGQDLPALAAYLKKYPHSEVKLLYFGSADPASYGITYIPFTDADYQNPGNLIYCISVNYLDGVSWAKKEKPIAKIGYSIFVYDLRKEE